MSKGRTHPTTRGPRRCGRSSAGAHAAASMRPEATEAARRILQAGGNAFDAAVAGQAALAVVDFAHATAWAATP